ncbi:hypothetical protein TPB0596_21590 [Tsukamurella pulmonis]|uniref:VOC family protein n=1 Tax=Tsukamurella pulmonis TaxID=47312 RepID=UPI001EDCE9E0|nr:VOC family protein [Tsukamurella pulmonis]BDD82396.1 hypothetical protein TPB0596_21590 [Tsukamurella pulmonis]
MPTITRVLTRVFVDDLDRALPLYEELARETAHRFDFRDVRLARVGPFLLLAGDTDAYRDRTATVEVSDLTPVLRALADAGAEIVEGPSPAPNGDRLIARHPDGAVFEYIEAGVRGVRAPAAAHGRRQSAGRAVERGEPHDARPGRGARDLARGRGHDRDGAGDQRHRPARLPGGASDVMPDGHDDGSRANPASARERLRSGTVEAPPPDNRRTRRAATMLFLLGFIGVPLVGLGVVDSDGGTRLVVGLILLVYIVITGYLMVRTIARR